MTERDFVGRGYDVRHHWPSKNGPWHVEEKFDDDYVPPRFAWRTVVGPNGAHFVLPDEITLEQAIKIVKLLNKK